MVNDEVAIADAVIPVAFPEVEVGKQCIDGPPCDFTGVDVGIGTFIRVIATYGEVFYTLKVVDERVENSIEWCGRQDIGLRIINAGLCGIGHIAEGADEIEVAQGTDSSCLGDVRLHLFFRVVGVDGLYHWSIVADGVTTVDSLVELSPTAIGVGWQKVLLEDFVDFVGHVSTKSHVITAQLAPNGHS